MSNVVVKNVESTRTQLKTEGEPYKHAPFVVVEPIPFFVHGLSLNLIYQWIVCVFVTRRILLVKKELPTLPENQGSPSVFSWVRVDSTFLTTTLLIQLYLMVGILLTLPHPFTTKGMGSTTTNGACLWSSVMKLSRDLNTFQVMTSTLFPGICGFVASLVATQLYQQNPNRKLEYRIN
jgi:hypothetical protein